MDMDQEALNESYQALNEFYRRYHADEEVRARIGRGDTSDLSGLNLPPGIELRILEQTADTFYFPMPVPPLDGVLSDEALDSVAGGWAYTGRLGCACIGW